MSVLDITNNPSNPKPYARRILNARSGPLTDPLSASDPLQDALNEQTLPQTPEIEAIFDVNPDPIVLEKPQKPPKSRRASVAISAEAGVSEPLSPVETPKKKRASGSRPSKSVKAAAQTPAPASQPALSAERSLPRTAQPAPALAAPSPLSAPKASRPPTPVRRAPIKSFQKPSPAASFAQPSSLLPSSVSFTPLAAHSDPQPSRPSVEPAREAFLSALAPQTGPRLDPPASAIGPQSRLESSPPEAPVETAGATQSVSIASHAAQEELESSPPRPAIARASVKASPRSPVARAAHTARNSAIGMALAYAERLESLFNPVVFLGRNWTRIFLAVLHLAAPLGAAWLISHWSAAQQQNFWSGSAFEQAINFAGLLILCVFGWSVAWLVLSSIGLACARALGKFQEEGAKFLEPK